MTHGVDAWIAQLGGGSAAMALLAAFLLGLRHATDPDHVAAVSTLVVSPEDRREAGAGRLGLSWGAGHALTVLALGVPVVFFGRWFPDYVRTAAELAVGLLIVGLAVRLLVRWRGGHFHAHPHRHGDLVHAHPHLHEGAHDHVTVQARAASHHHGHAHGTSLGRSPVESFGIGLVHGVGGSAGAGVLLVASADDTGRAILALLLFAGGTAASMTVLSALVGRVLDRRSVAARVDTVVPAFGAFSLLFGAWYALGALKMLPYVF